MSKCIYAAETADKIQTCSLKLCSKEKLHDCCVTCSEYTGPDRGLGDKVKNMAASLGFKPCGGCQRRREALNRWSEKRRNMRERKNQ